ASNIYQAIRIPIETDSSGNHPSYYYLEYRKPTGVFDNFSVTDAVVNGLSLRLVTKQMIFGHWWQQSNLIDFNPSTPAYTPDESFPKGTTFNDPDRGISITPFLNPTGSNISQNVLSVNIQITGQPWLCQHVYPTA